MAPFRGGRRAVGRVLKPHGVRGELVVEIRTDTPEQRFAPGSVLGTDPEHGPVTVASARPHGERLLVWIEGVAGRDGAEALRGVLLTVEVGADDPSDDPEEFADHQLEGLRVVLGEPAGGGRAGETVGTVREVLHGPGGDMLVVAREGAADALVPFVHALVPEVDLDGGRIVLTPPEGLLD